MTDLWLWPDDTVADERIVTPPPRAARNVTRPVLRPGPLAAEGGPAVVLCPGGGFHLLSLDTEGHELADLLAGQGIASYVLEYRLIATPPDEAAFGVRLMEVLGDRDELHRLIEEHRPVFRADGERAVELLRERHDRVAVVGFSAGGILAADLAALPSGPSRPDAVACVYTPSGVPSSAPVDAPPLFLLAAADDPLGVTGSFDLQRAWTAAGRAVDLHLFAYGGHGFGTTPTGFPVDAWPGLLTTWLLAEGFGRR